MIATLGALNLGAAHWTEDDSINSLAPPLEVLLHRIFTACAVTVPVLSAAEAYSMVALRTLELSGIHIFCNHVAIAFGLCAEACQWIALEDPAFPEIVQFVKQLAILTCEDFL